MPKGSAKPARGGGRPSPVATRSKGAKKAAPKPDGTEHLLNDQDHFENSRGSSKIRLEQHEAEDLDDGFDEDEQEQAVFDLEDASDDDDDEDENDEDEEDDDDDEELDLETERALRKLKMRGAYADEDELLGVEKTKKKEVSEKAWGPKKSAYYQDEEGDEEEAAKGKKGAKGKEAKEKGGKKGGKRQKKDAEDSEEDAAKDEENEARRLQREKYSAMQDADFGGDDEDPDSFQAQLSKPKKSQSDTPKKAAEAGKKRVALAPSAPAPEKVAKDLSALSQEELLAIVTSESPELVELLGEFKDKLAEVREHLHPLLEKVRAGELPMSKGISFLEMKYHVMLSYCTNIAFYLMLKASGGRVKDHPVIGQLVELRTVMEKIKSLEQKLQYQIDKLVRTANTGAPAKNDPLRFRPNPASMLKGALAGGGAGNEDDDDADGKKDAVYRPTKIAPVHYDESGDKNKRQQERLKQKASRSRLLKDLREEFSEQPEAVVYREELDEHDRRQQEKLVYEEDNFVRLPVTREDKKKTKKRFANELANLDDFGDLAALEKSDIAATGQMGRKRKAADLGGPAAGGRKDASILDALNEVATEFGEGGDLDGDLDDSYYQEVKSAKKKAKKQKREAAAEAAAGEDDGAFDGGDDDEGAEGGKRQLTKAMLKNRGLTAHKKKEIKNPRVKRRVKYEQAKKKLKSIVRPMADTSRPYQGEMTGIKANLARSVKIK